MQATYLSSARYGWPARSAREPVGMRLEEVLRGAIRVHPRHDEEAVVMRGFRQLAEQIAAVEELGAMVQREIARVVGDDTAGVDDDGLRARALPVPRHHRCRSAPDRFSVMLV